MPYEVKKTAQGYFVVNKETGKKYSKKPLTKPKAEKQLIALRINTTDEEGGGLADYLKSAYRKIAEKATAVSSAISGTVQALVSGRDDYPPAERDLIRTYGDSKITGICLYREKLASGVNTLVNVISLGQFNKVKDKYGIDELYHLYMVITVGYNGTSVPILIEKNEVINIHEYPKISPTAQKLELLISPNFDYTFKHFLDDAQGFMGNDYFVYDAITNNCQRFIKSLILANPPLEKDNPECLKFVEQDTTGLERDLSPTSKNIFRGITDLASKFNILAKGKGFDNSNPDHHYTV